MLKGKDSKYNINETENIRYKISNVIIPSIGKKVKKWKLPYTAAGRRKWCDYFPINLATSNKDEMQTPYNPGCTHTL